MVDQTLHPTELDGWIDNRYSNRGLSVTCVTYQDIPPRTVRQRCRIWQRLSKTTKDSVLRIRVASPTLLTSPPRTMSRRWNVRNSLKTSVVIPSTTRTEVLIQKNNQGVCLSLWLSKKNSSTSVRTEQKRAKPPRTDSRVIGTRPGVGRNITTPVAEN